VGVIKSIRVGRFKSIRVRWSRGEMLFSQSPCGGEAFQIIETAVCGLKNTLSVFNPS
jgi:hypothetical protein